MKFLLNSLLTVLLFLHFLSSTHAFTELIFNTTRLTYNPKYFANLSLTTQDGKLNSDSYLSKPLQSGFRMYLDIQLRLSNSQNYQSLFHYDIDICSAEVVLRDNLVRKWLRSLLPFSNFMENCPVNIGRYKVQDYHLDSSLIPRYLRQGDYRIKAHSYFGKYRQKNEILVADCEIDCTLI